MKTILVVEDSKTINKVVTSILKKKSAYEVLSTFSLAEARDVLKKKKIDFIFLDINLPDGNGYELVEQIGFNETKIFVMTTEDDRQFVEMNYQKGVIEFIVKDKAFAHKAKKFPQKIEKIERNKNKTVLIVDDSSFIRIQMEKLFKNRNYNVFSVANTLQALEILQERKIDLILLDIELKNENGIDFLQKHRLHIVDEQAIPVMIVSGYVDDVVTKLALKAGAVDVLKKPYVTEEIVLKSDFWIDYNTLNEKVSTLQQEFDEAIKEKRFFKTLLDASMEMTFIHDNNLYILDLNKTASQALGAYTKEEIIGRNLKEFLFKESIALLEEKMQIHEQTIFEGKLRGESVRDILIKTESYIENDREFFITTALDITDMKEKELQLIQQSKLAQMGEMLSMIAHQWRQPLNIISTLNEIMLLKAKKSGIDFETLEPLSKKIFTQLKYMSKTIDDFKEFFKPTKKPKHTTLDEIIYGVIELTEASLANKKVQVHLDIETKKTLFTFFNEVQQALINIIKNAEDALEKNDPSNRKIYIKAYSEKFSSTIEIEDNAGGIDEKILLKIFDPYFSTKGKKNGTGLGLYMTRMIIEKHCHGSVDVKNTKEGAKFIIELPNMVKTVFQS